MYSMKGRGQVQRGNIDTITKYCSVNLSVKENTLISSLHPGIALFFSKKRYNTKHISSSENLFKVIYSIK